MHCKLVGPATFMAKGAAMLEARPGLNQQMIGLATECLDNESRALLFLVHRDNADGDVVGAVAFVFRGDIDCATSAVVAGQVSAATMQALAASLDCSSLGRLSRVSTIAGPQAEAQCFAEGYAEHFGGAASPHAPAVLETMVLTVAPALGSVAGSLVQAKGSLDIKLLQTLMVWFSHFVEDANSRNFSEEEKRAFLEEKARAGDLYIWKTEDGRPTAVAAATSRIGESGRQLGFVFTERGHRGKGYGEAIVRASCADWLQQCSFVALVADVASSSNTVRLYEKVGFKSDGQQGRFRVD
eukprot:CAMPEP_0115440430 /NCGR_PEP_ID=MMETSP0271-20121206/36294_1 /TAXON_ID=71861 /ORGANISM="Scrippsiella trochoidea, Strain CCMP3099" /LENGTH=297 /DNA_ID=CAMNT_0002866165 /DNA_START=71 /DNA_END=964 /DNA_ORIENTATION=-